MFASSSRGVKAHVGPADISVMSRMDFHPAHRAAAWALAAVCASGCGGVRMGANAVKTDASARAAMAQAEAQHDSLVSARAPVPEYPDAAPRERQLPADVVEALKGTAEPWMFAWRVDLGTFRMDQLARTWTHALPGDVAPYDGNAEGEDLRLTFLATPGPSGTTALDPYGEWALVREGEIVHAHRAQAPSVAFIDLANHERRRVLDLSDRFARVDGALWLDGDRFVIFAAERFESNPWSGGPVLYVVDLRHSQVTRFSGPGGTYEGYQAVGRDLDRKFRGRLTALVFDGA